MSDYSKKMDLDKETMMRLKVGQPAPDFSLPSHLDKTVTLSDLRGKDVVLAFYPQAWTPI
jgi:peroxiredoxin